MAAGVSHSLIMGVSNDVMQLGLEFFASKGVHKLSFESQIGKIQSCDPRQTIGQVGTVQTRLPGCPTVSL